MAGKKRRKPAPKMTSDEIAAHVFPPEVHRHLKKAANPDDVAEGRPRPQQPRQPSNRP